MKQTKEGPQLVQQAPCSLLCGSNLEGSKKHREMLCWEPDCSWRSDHTGMRFYSEGIASKHTSHAPRNYHSVRLTVDIWTFQRRCPSCCITCYTPPRVRCFAARRWHCTAPLLPTAVPLRHSLSCSLLLLFNTLTLLGCWHIMQPKLLSRYSDQAAARRTNKESYLIGAIPLCCINIIVY